MHSKYQNEICKEGSEQWKKLRIAEMSIISILHAPANCTATTIWILFAKHSTVENDSIDSNIWNVAWFRQATIVNCKNHATLHQIESIIPFSTLHRIKIWAPISQWTLHSKVNSNITWKVLFLFSNKSDSNGYLWKKPK